MKKKIIAGITLVIGVGLISAVIPYPKEAFCVAIGIFAVIGGLIVLLED